MKNNKTYLVGFKGKETSLYDQNGSLIRKFRSRCDVVNAQITYAGQNPTVAITLQDGKYELYKVNGELMRSN